MKSANKMVASEDVDMQALRIVMSIVRMGAYLDRTGNRLIEEFNINQQQLVILNEIIIKNELSQKQLVGEFLYEKSNVSKIVKKLKSMALIDVKKSEQDARVTLLRATEEGRNVAMQSIRKFTKWNEEWIKLLSEKERNETIKVLDRLSEL